MEAVSAYDFISHMELEGHECIFVVKRHPESESRYHSYVTWDELFNGSFNMVSTPTGKWVISGADVPDWITNNSAAIARCFEEQISIEKP